MERKIKELVAKINFFSFSFVTIISLSLVGEIMMENDFPDKIDDITMTLLGIIGIIWYKKRGYKSPGTTGSVVMFILAILIKIGAVVVEHADREAVGDDFGVLAALVLGFVFTLWMISRVNKNN